MQRMQSGIKLIGSLLIDEPRHLQAYLELLYIYLFIFLRALRGSLKYSAILHTKTSNNIYGKREIWFLNPTQRMRRIFRENWLYSFAIKEAYTNNFFQYFPQRLHVNFSYHCFPSYSSLHLRKQGFVVLKKVGNEEQSKSFQKWLAQCVPQFLCFQRSSKRHQCFPSYSSLHLRIQGDVVLKK